MKIVIEAVVVAGGSGKRMGDVYKQFSLIDGKQQYLYSVEKFLEYGVKKVILVVPKEKVIEGNFEAVFAAVRKQLEKMGK